MASPVCVPNAATSWLPNRRHSLREPWSLSRFPSRVGGGSAFYVISMNLMDHNPLVKRAVSVLLLLMSAAFIVWFSFRQGERHIAGPLAVRMASESCVDCWAGLTALK